MASNSEPIGLAIVCGRAGENTACEGVMGPGEVGGVECESESESESVQCDDSEESESEATGDEGGET